MAEAYILQHFLLWLLFFPVSPYINFKSRAMTFQTCGMTYRFCVSGHALTIDENETKCVAFSEAESVGVLLGGVALRLVHFAVSSC